MLSSLSQALLPLKLERELPVDFSEAGLNLPAFQLLCKGAVFFLKQILIEITVQWANCYQNRLGLSTIGGDAWFQRNQLKTMFRQLLGKMRGTRDYGIGHAASLSSSATGLLGGHVITPLPQFLHLQHGDIDIAPHFQNASKFADERLCMQVRH